MKISNCLKVVLLCGCPPDNSNFQLQLGEESGHEEETQKPLLVRSQPEPCIRSELDQLNSEESINVCDDESKDLYSSDYSGLSLDCLPEVPYQDEQKAVALILEYLKMKYPPKPSVRDPQQHLAVSLMPKPKAEESKWRGRAFQKSKSLPEPEGNHQARLLRESNRRRKSLDLVLNTRRGKVSGEKRPKRRKTTNRQEEIEVEKERVKSPKIRAPSSFFRRLTCHSGMHFRTIMETSDIEIKEVVLSETNQFKQTQEREKKQNVEQKEATRSRFKNKPAKNGRVVQPCNRTGGRCKKFLSPDVSIVLNPNVLDEVSPYILRFVKQYLGDFRRYLLDAFIGVDSISLNYFESMIKVIDSFPIDDLTLFKNLKYTLALLFPPEVDGTAVNPENERNENIGARYPETLKRKLMFDPGNRYKYTIKTKEPSLLDSKSMGDLPSFLVRYYPTGSKLLKNQCLQTDSSVSV